MPKVQAKIEAVETRVPALVGCFTQEEVMSEVKVRLANRLVLAYVMLIGVSVLLVGYAVLQLVYSSMSAPTYFSVPELVLLLIISSILLVEFLIGFRRDLKRLRALEQ